MPRLFIATELSAEALQLATQIEEALQAALRRRTRVRWTRNEGRHVTLAFLGQVDDSRVAELGQLVAAVAARHQPLAVKVGGMGAFPNTRRARVLWVGVADASGALERLAADLQQSLRSVGYELDEREFRGHVTLGRVADRQGVDVNEAHAEVPAQSVAVQLDALVLFESQLSPSGARYRQLRRATLGAAGHAV
ncbi:MAG: RNA 2',3'-cyclic phosphodiesterase [Deltaproteobacteria bacterium]|nr:RNA 2',3'-cyclic phosphodiesterase [Deltaproteobacteria bacterium]